MFNIPVSMAIFDTANTIHRVNLARKFIAVDLAYPYVNTNKEEQKSIVGALTFNKYNELEVL